MRRGGRRILIVEDQRLIAADLENTLKKLGYVVASSAAEGQEAIDKARELAPDLILMDIRLRGAMDGIETAAVIRKHADVPVIYLTAYADEETIARAKATSPFGYVVKPFNERELRAAIEVALYKYETERLLEEERARRRAAEEFKLLVHGVKDYAIFMLDENAHVASWNEGAERIQGYATAEILGKHFSVLFLPDEHGPGRLGAVLETSRCEGRAELEGWGLRKDGSSFWAGVAVTPVREPNGEPRGFGVITRDLTERRRAEQQRERLISELKDAVRSRDEFLQIASHELKTPLTPLQLQLDALARALQRTDLDNATLATKLETAARQTARLSRLVESLLDVSRITAGGVQIYPEPLDLADLVREVSERFRLESGRAGCELVVRTDPHIMGCWDRLRIEQILSNLLANAIKYGAGQPITIEGRISDGSARISVTDRGIGIQPEALERIFERFERAVSSRHFGGLGLGLFIAREFAEAHGGDITAQSQPGAGSTFTVVLPLGDGAQDGTAESAGTS